ncbi:MAG: AraC family transcriptional regulator, partial [Saprospiraceae bacterium]|nr:AraC family transcriptional regulator [Saprospiraceae bacterium]
PAIPIVERQSPKQTSKNKALNEAFMDRIREVVENNISNTDFRVEDLCKALRMSHSKLHRKTVTASGMTPQQVIRQMRLDYATEQLNNPQLNINEIALQAGFEDPGYFTRVFKREKGLTPTEWRDEYGSSDKDFY